MHDSPLQVLFRVIAQLPDGVLDGVVILIGAWMVTFPAGWLVARLMRKKNEQLETSLSAGQHVIPTSTRGFADGGKVIGRLERLLIYLFVLSNALGAVGFLIAAKSIFRFGELSDQKNRLEAEYITIGTLLSFAVGLAIAMGVRWITFGG
ncbi:hypothetical protein Pla108_29580 [Botrimarina colliarenosi]|uniref:Uncharacterized protein n=1 Tax=Botrimarina colliarenosi TaxID=2528001 RepID=A0A5C6AA17_9BACT|nr:hypothetical protein [Botrimarina colliarenosi]TWT95881.1 hypothetical protein Pla108_29580 [Botrimarina colliarenosi]